MTHTLNAHTDGDGWNEPHHEEFTCSCGGWHTEWTQTDPNSSDRPDLFAETLPAWSQHVNEVMNTVIEMTALPRIMFDPDKTMTYIPLEPAADVMANVTRKCSIRVGYSGQIVGVDIFGPDLNNPTE